MSVVDCLHARPCRAKEEFQVLFKDADGQRLLYAVLSFPDPLQLGMHCDTPVFSHAAFQAP